MRCMLPLFVIGTVLAQDARRHPPGSPLQGLPKDPGAFRPYHDDPGHPQNRIFRLSWLGEITPAEVGRALPTEGPVDLAEGWVHRKRTGADSDRRWFGGDGRQLPIERLAPGAGPALREALASIGPKERRVLLDPPELAVLFQHDLLRVAARLLETGADADILPDLWRAARFVALDAAERSLLRDPLRPAMGSTAHGSFAADLPAELGGTTSLAFREVLRRSTRLFDAERTLLWSRVLLAHPEGAAGSRPCCPTARQRTGARRRPPCRRASGR